MSIATARAIFICAAVSLLSSYVLLESKEAR
jgi:hypothetical protein